MRELFQFAVEPHSLIYTLLLGLMVLYWITVMIGALDIEFFDLDLEVDVDADLDLDIEVDAEVDTDLEAESGGTGGFLGFLTFFNLGHVPFMIFLGVLILSLWLGSIVGNYYWGGLSPFFPLILFVPNLLAGLFVTKVITHPMKGVYKKLNKQALTKKQLVGKLAHISTGLSTGKIGQAEINHEEGAFLINVHTEELRIERGTQVIIVEYDEEKDSYLVKEFEL